MARKKLSFEEALRQLETIAEQIEQGKIGLEESISKYEQGMALLKQCQDTLAKAEQKIQQIHQRADGSLETKPIKRLEQEASPGQEADATT